MPPATTKSLPSPDPDGTPKGAKQSNGALKKAPRLPIPEAQVKLVFALSAGYCAFPDCSVRTVIAATVSDPAAVIGEIAHIHSYEDSGPRAKVSLTRSERNQYPNLVLFCPTHHTLVDKQPNSHPAEVLLGWKVALEGRICAALAAVMTSIHFAELNEITKSLLSVDGSRSVDFKVIPPQEKMDKNGLTSATRMFVTIALAKASVVTEFVSQFSKADSTFADRLRAGFVTRYARLSATGKRGDDLFEEMLAFASSNQVDLRSRAAGLAVLGYFFEACEVFEK